MRIQGIKVLSRSNQFVYDAIHGTELVLLWITKGRVRDKSFNLVDWKGINGAINNLLSQYGDDINIILGTYGVGISMKRWIQRITDQCSYCGISGEDTTHAVRYNAWGVV